MTYTKDDPKWVKAESVTSEGNGFYKVVAYGQTYNVDMQSMNTGWIDKKTDYALVKNQRGDWLKVWWYDADVATPPPA